MAEQWKIDLTLVRFMRVRFEKISEALKRIEVTKRIIPREK